MFNNSITDIQHFVQTLLEQIKALTKELLLSRKEITELREKESKLRQTNSLRQKSDRPNGGQPGHKGITLEISSTPDEVIVHSPDYCTACGGSLIDTQAQTSETRQIVDIPLPIRTVVINHVCETKRCTCGHCTSSDFPAYVKTGVSYGPNIQATVAYLSVCQHVPFKRLVQILEMFYGVSLSQGTISNILNRMHKQAQPGYQAICQQIEIASVAGADETGCKVNGQLQWMWTFQNELVTYIFQHSSRGKTVIDQHFPNGLPNTILVTDRHSSYFNMETAGHQLCLAHLLRNLIYLEELDTGQKWSTQMLELIRDGIHQRKSKTFEQIDKQHFKDRFNILMQQNLLHLDSKFQGLQKSLIKHQGDLFTFLERKDVPPDNNASERTIRPIKVKMKVSGMFKTPDGGDAFSTLYSIANTAIKNNQNPFEALIAVAKNC